MNSDRPRAMQAEEVLRFARSAELRQTLRDNLLQRRTPENAHLLSDDLVDLYVDLSMETDRGVALTGTAYLDELLEQLLRAAMPTEGRTVDRLLDDHGPLGSFMAKVSTCYALGLIEQDVRTSLELVAQIRNRFAHLRGTRSFDAPDVAERIRQLPFPADGLGASLRSFGASLDDAEAETLLREPRRRFIGYVGITAGRMHIYILQHATQRIARTAADQA